MDKVKVVCSRKWCKFGGSYPTLQSARRAIADHKAETSGYQLGVHEAGIMSKTARGSGRSNRQTTPTR
jgi:hypothetical protein